MNNERPSFFLIPATSGLCIEPKSNSISTSNITGHDTQKWHIHEASGSSKKLAFRNVASRKYLHVLGGYCGAGVAAVDDEEHWFSLEHSNTPNAFWIASERFPNAYLSNSSGRWTENNLTQVWNREDWCTQAMVWYICNAEEWETQDPNSQVDLDEILSVQNPQAIAPARSGHDGKAAQDREQELAALEKGLMGNIEQLEKKQKEIHHREQELEAKDRAFAKGIQQLKEKEERFTEQQQQLQAREDIIAKSLQELEAREKALFEHQHDIEIKESALKHKEKQLKAREQALQGEEVVVTHSVRGQVAELDRQMAEIQQGLDQSRTTRRHQLLATGPEAEAEAKAYKSPAQCDLSRHVVTSGPAVGGTTGRPRVESSESVRRMVNAGCQTGSAAVDIAQVAQAQALDEVHKTATGGRWNELPGLTISPRSSRNPSIKKTSKLSPIVMSRKFGRLPLLRDPG